MTWFSKHTDKYFLRAKRILEAEHINPYVCYQFFARQNRARIEGISEVVKFINENAPSASINHIKENQQYQAGKPIMKVEGLAQELIDLETVCLSILSGRNTSPLNFNEIKENTRNIVREAKDKPLFYFGARHFGWWDDSMIAAICAEVGFAGCSTDCGAIHWGTNGVGTIPHSLIIILSQCFPSSNVTVKAAQLLYKYFPNIPQIALIDTFNREVDDSLAAIEACPNLQGVRIDTCGENFAQLSSELGVCISSVQVLSMAIEKHFPKRNIRIMVSSGFNASKIRKFQQAISYCFDGIGTGSIYPSFTTTADIIRVKPDRNSNWIQASKVGREEKYE